MSAFPLDRYAYWLIMYKIDKKGRTWTWYNSGIERQAS